MKKTISITALILLTCFVFSSFAQKTDSKKQKEEVNIKMKRNNDNKFGFVDDKGNQVIPAKYDNARDFNEADGLAPVCIGCDFTGVKRGGKWGYINIKGEEIVPLKYAQAYPFSNGLGRIRNSDSLCEDCMWALINKKGKILTPFKYDEIRNPSEGYAVVCVGLAAKKPLYGIIDSTGKEIVAPMYKNIGNYKNGFCSVQAINENKWGYLNKKGEVAIPIKYAIGFPFSEGMACVGMKDSTMNKFGFIDVTGKEAIKCQYESASSFVNGLAKVKLNKKWTYINKAGKTISDFKYDMAMDFINDVTFVKMDNKWGLINKEDKKVVDFKYDEASGFRDGFAKVKIAGKVGFIDKTGKQIAECKYDKMEEFNYEGKARITLGEKKGYVSTEGEEIWDK